MATNQMQLLLGLKSVAFIPLMRTLYPLTLSLFLMPSPTLTIRHHLLTQRHLPTLRHLLIQSHLLT